MPASGRSRVGRIVKGAGLSLVVLVLAAGGWVLFWTFYNPHVVLAEPVVISRTPLKSDDITIVLGGDFAPTDAAMPMIRAKGWQWPFQGTHRIFEHADVTFANLESPVTTSRDPFPLHKAYIYRTDPAAVPAFVSLGLDVINLANNHIFDYRDRGVTDTIAALDGAGLAHIGAGRDETAARRPVIVDVGGTRIGFLGYLEDTLANNLYFRAFAVGDRVGAARLIRDDFAEDIKRLRPLCDILIVSVHWGENYQPVTAHQMRLGQELADLGVDLVVGHHPHIAQPVAVHGKTTVLYSLGNYAWGAIGRSTLQIGLLARVHISPRRGTTPAKVRLVELIPIRTQNRVTSYSPRPLVPTEMSLLAPLLREATRMGTPLRWNGRLLFVPMGDAMKSPVAPVEVEGQ
jgi:poly-gamma-glutamate synthesis protein (capsule biosynthesis protein)